MVRLIVIVCRKWFFLDPALCVGMHKEAAKI